MADEHLITATIAGRTGEVAVDVFRRDTAADYGNGLPGSPALPVELEIGEYGPVKGGEMKPGQLGGGLLGAFWEVEFIDPEGYVEHLWGGGYEESDTYVRLSGPDGLGGTFRFFASALPVEIEDEQAPAVHASGAVRVAFRDGVGRLQDLAVDYPIRSRADAAQLLRLLAVAAPHPVVARLPVWPRVGSGDGEADDRSVHRVQFHGSPFSAGGDKWGAEDSVGALARLQSLLVFQPTDLEDPEWYALPRAQVGLEIEDATEVTGAYTVGSTPTYPVTVPARAVTVDGAWGGGAGEQVPQRGLKRVRPAVVRLEASGDVQLTRDDEFAFGPSGAGTEGDFTFWPTVAGTPARGPGLLGGIELQAGGLRSVTALTQAGGTATCTTSQPHFLYDGAEVTIAGADQAGYNGTHTVTVVDADTFTFPVDPGTPSPATGSITADGSEAAEVVAQSLGRFAATPGIGFYVEVQRDAHAAVYYGAVRLRLDGDDATTYYYDPAAEAWGTDVTELDLTPTDLALDLATALAGALPVAGEVFLELVGETANVAGLPSAHFRRARAWPTDDEGESFVRTFEASPVADYVVPGGAEEKAIPLPANALVDAAPVLAWTSDATGGEYATLREAAAAERLAQATKAGGAPLRTVVTTVPGLVGPQNRVTLSGAPPFDAEPLVAVVTGYEMDLKHGLTKLALCEVTTSGLS